MTTLRPLTRAVDLDITGMTCASCANRIERRLNRLPGTEATVNYATGTAHVRSSDVGLPQLVGAVEAAGYGAAVSAPHRPEQDRGPVARLAVAAVLTAPVVVLSMVHALHVPGWQWIVVALSAPVVTWAAWPFHRVAVAGLRHGALTMDTLVSLGVIVSTLWSVATAAGLVEGESYLEVAAVVTVFVLAGRVAEAFARRRSMSALRALAEAGAREAGRVRDGVEERVPVAALAVGDLVRVRPGEKVPSDGVVVDGFAAIDAALVTGESLPVEAAPGDAVVGGAVVAGGSVVVRVTRVGADTELARIARLVAEAQQGKAAAQRLADRVSGVFVPIVVVLAVLATAGWLLAGADVPFAIAAGVSTLIIACPCALGLAVPTALLVGTGRGAQLGLLVRGPVALERTHGIDTVVLDKTGTLTTGRMAVDQVVPLGGFDAAEVLRLAGAAERGSEHPIGRAILRAAEERGAVPAATGFVAEPGGGVRGEVEGRRVAAGSAAWLGLPLPPLGTRTVDTAAARGATPVVLAVEGVAVAVLVLADTVRPEAAAAVARLRALGLDPVLVTGDGPGAAAAVARAVGIDRVQSAVRPEGKAEAVRSLLAAGHRVAVVGDGVNDAAALASADLGIAIGGGTDAAAAAADITLVRSDLTALPDAVRLARRTLATIRGNLVWAFLYNAAAIPLAMAGLLSPMIAGAAMAASSVLVVGNSLRLARFQPTR